MRKAGRGLRLSFATNAKYGYGPDVTPKNRFVRPILYRPGNPIPAQLVAIGAFVLAGMAALYIMRFRPPAVEDGLSPVPLMDGPTAATET